MGGLADFFVQNITRCRDRLVHRGLCRLPGVREVDAVKIHLSEDGLPDDDRPSSRRAPSRSATEYDIKHLLVLFQNRLEPPTNPVVDFDV